MLLGKSRLTMNKDNSKIIVPAGISKFTITIETILKDYNAYDHIEPTYIIAVGKKYAIGTILHTSM